MRYVIPILSVIFVIGGFTALLIKGGAPERRYEHSACQYRMIYQYTPEEPMGLVTLGGSRMRVATSSDHFDEVLAEIRPEAAPVHNLSHSIFAFGKEYVLMRDFLEVHSPKAILVQVLPRANRFGSAHSSFPEIARLSDIPLAVRTLWPENKVNALQLARNILSEHLSAFDKVGKPHRESTERNCDLEDYRLSVDSLRRSEEIFERKQKRALHLEWDLDAPREEGVLRWVEAYRELSETTGTQIIFVLMSATTDSLPRPEFEAEFEARTGLKLIVFDQDIHETLARDGRRDSSHLNKKGRESFLPWLVSQIEEKCTRVDGCF